MMRRRWAACSMTMWVILMMVLPAAHGLVKEGFYSTSCPQAELLISSAVQAAASFNPSIPPKLLRLLFHDCFVGGCDASILLDSTPTETAEKEDPANANLEGLGVITNIKRTVELACAGVVSCADIIALAARDAVVAMGGPKVEIPTGRLDGLSSRALDVRSNLPDTPFSMEQLLEFFGRKGLDHQDLAALSAMYTIWAALPCALKVELRWLDVLMMELLGERVEE
ncbi:hypothetical protein L7F22_052481 [Adiantum nelumboides]|nr:hypothetical protein [Adiantum nelumboides]